MCAVDFMGRANYIAMAWVSTPRCALCPAPAVMRSLQVANLIAFAGVFSTLVD